MRIAFQVTSGFLLVGIGLVGVVLPVMPGWIFLIPGLALLGRHFPWARRLRERLRPSSPPPGGSAQPPVSR